MPNLLEQEGWTTALATEEASLTHSCCPWGPLAAQWQPARRGCRLQRWIEVVTSSGLSSRTSTRLGWNWIKGYQDYQGLTKDIQGLIKRSWNRRILYDSWLCLRNIAFPKTSAFLSKSNHPLNWSLEDIGRALYIGAVHHLRDISMCNAPRCKMPPRRLATSWWDQRYDPCFIKSSLDALDKVTDWIDSTGQRTCLSFPSWWIVRWSPIEQVISELHYGERYGEICTLDNGELQLQ